MNILHPQQTPFSLDQLEKKQAFEIKDRKYSADKSLTVTCLYIGHPEDQFIAYQPLSGPLSKKVVLLRLADNLHDDAHLVTREFVVKHFDSSLMIQTFDECDKSEQDAMMEKPKKKKERCLIS